MKRLAYWLVVLCLLLAGCRPAAPVPEAKPVQPSVTEKEAPQEQASQTPRPTETAPEAPIPVQPPVTEKEAPQEQAPQTPCPTETAPEAPIPVQPPVTEKEAPQEQSPQTPFPAETVPEIPAPQEEVEASAATDIPEKGPACVLSICCQKALEYAELDPALRQLLPEDGWLLPQTETPITPGESVFDVLLRTVRQQSIHMEFASAAVYGSAYIEGIGGLYEFDCGGESGWTYSVNGVSPNVGCSSYAVSNGDIIVWEYITERT